MKAHHGGLEFVEHVGGFGIEGRAPRPDGNGVYIDSMLFVIGRKRSSPSRLALGTGRGRRVAKEIHVKRFAGLCLDRGEFIEHRVKTEHGTGQ